LQFINYRPPRLGDIFGIITYYRYWFRFLSSRSRRLQPALLNIRW